MPTLSALFYQINDLLPPNQQLLVVTSTTSATTAIARMDARGVEQAPVIEDGAVVGVFSLSGYARYIAQQAGPVDVAAVTVAACLERPVFVGLEDKLDARLDQLIDAHALLVGAPRGVHGVITATDALRYMAELAEPFLVIAEIELALRAIIGARLTVDDLADALPHLHANSVAEYTEDFTFNDYTQLITRPAVWHKLADLFGGGSQHRAAERERLESVRRIRNAVFHFRRPFTSADAMTLSNYRDLLFERVRRLEARLTPPAATGQ